MSPDPSWRPYAIEFVLLLLTAMMTMAETACDLLDEKSEKQEANKNLLKMAKKPAGFLSPLQSGRICLSVFGAVYFALAVSGSWTDYFSGLGADASSAGFISLVLISLICLFAFIVFGLHIPRHVAYRAQKQSMQTCSSVTVGISALFFPLSYFMRKVSEVILRVCGIDPKNTSKHVTEEEILAMVDIGEEKGAIEADEKEMIENIFEFNNMTAEDCMVHRKEIIAVCKDDSREEILKLIRESGRSRFPVYEDDIDSITGILTTREYLLNASSEHPLPLEQFLRPAYFVPESMRTDVLFREMQRRKQHIAIVVDEYGGTSGLVTMEDLLEEIVGNIYDEFDKAAEVDLIRLPDGRYRVSGSCELETFAEALEIEIPEEDEEIDTVGGLIFSRLTEIPHDGEHPEIQCFGLDIRTEKILDRRVEWAIVTKLPEESGEIA